MLKYLQLSLLILVMLSCTPTLGAEMANNEPDDATERKVQKLFNIPVVLAVYSSFFSCYYCLVTPKSSTTELFLKSCLLGFFFGSIGGILSECFRDRKEKYSKRAVKLLQNVAYGGLLGAGSWVAYRCGQLAFQREQDGLDYQVEPALVSGFCAGVATAKLPNYISFINGSQESDILERLGTRLEAFVKNHNENEAAVAA